MSPKVALVSYDDAPPIGGQGRIVESLEQEMPQAGFQVEVLSPRRGPWGTGVRIPKRTRRAPLDYSLWLRRRLPEAASALQPDLWHAMGGPGGVLLFRHPSGAPLVFTANHTYRTAHGRRLASRPLGSIEARAYRFAEHVIAISPSTASSLVKDYGVAPERVSVIPPGIEGRWLAAGPERAQRDSLLFVGRLVPIKGVQHFVALFRALQGEFPELRAEICGDGPLRRPAQSMAKEFQGRLLVRGRVSEDDLAQAYRQARVLVVPSRFEGFGIVALEGMAAGTPVVAHDVPGLTDLRGGGVTLVPPDRPAELAQAVRRLLSDPAFWREQSQAAREAVEQRFAWSALRPQVAEVYRSVLASSSSQLA